MALLLLPAACGGDDGNDSAGGDGGAGTSQAATGNGADGSTPGDGEGGEDGEGTGGGGGGLGAAVGESAQGGNSLTGTWEGTYNCAQGETPLELSLVDADDDSIQGFFEFGPVPGTPDLAGNFRVTGTHDGDTLSLEGLDWVEQPETYGMVGLEAETAGRDDPDRLEGTVVGDGCESFSLERVTTDPWYVGTWEGGYICAQGRTGMTLTVTGTGGNNVEALYEFYPLPDGPDLPPGSYEMTGTWVDAGLTLQGEEWVEQPEGYVMVGISSSPEAAIGPDQFAGTVDDPGCEQFILNRAEG